MRRYHNVAYSLISSLALPRCHVTQALDKGDSVRTEPRKHRKLHGLCLQEEREEGLRDYLPPKPLLPAGWRLDHKAGCRTFSLNKSVEIRECGKENLFIVAFLENKEYEGTYRMDNGEREEQEYINFTLFIEKERYPKGGLEFGLTSIDMELVLDSLAIHTSPTQLKEAKESLIYDPHNLSKPYISFRKTMRRYRGPMLTELDDDLSDEILDYLDERGVNNVFSEFIMAQAYYLEQEEYINWLRLLRQFSN